MNPLFPILLMAAIGTIPVLTASISRLELASDEDGLPNSTRNIIIGIASALALLTLIARVMFLLRHMRRREAAEARAAKDVSGLLGPPGSTSAGFGMVSGTQDAQHSPYAAVEYPPVAAMNGAAEQALPLAVYSPTSPAHTEDAPRVLTKGGAVLAASDPTHDRARAMQQLIVDDIKEKNLVREADSDELPGYNEGSTS